MVPVAGVDGCRGGWVVVTDGDAFVCSDFAAVLGTLDDDTVVAVDMPIGLLDEYIKRGRKADQEARERLPGKKSSVFSAPARPALQHPDDYNAAKKVVNGHLPKQTFALVKKLIEVDELTQVVGQQRIREVHPEVTFGALNSGRPVLSKKRTAEGQAERRSLLQAAGIDIPQRPHGAAEDDLLDACAALWSAQRIGENRAERVPDEPPVDSLGLRMEIVW